MSNSLGPLLQHLPGIYHHPENQHLHKLLSVFEGVLFGPGEEDFEGLEQKIAKIPSLFNPVDPEPFCTPSEFLPWLAQWVAFSQYHEMPEDRLRKLIAAIIPLYGQRGTKEHLEKMLKFFMPEDSVININDQELPSLILGRSVVGLDSRLGGDMPFWFLVKIHSRFTTRDPEERKRLKKELENKARSVIDLVKPAHTTYQLEWEFEDLEENLL
jgi:phage tail-like protein